jgi:biotin transport system ATP-binding protein
MGQRRPDSLSGGERRRLSIAGTLAMEAECLILDEPFANLDFESIRLVLKTVTELHAQGTTIVLVTHELEKVLAHATRLAIMDSGAIVYDGAPDGLDPADFERHGLSNPYRNQSLRSDLSWIS